MPLLNTITTPYAEAFIQVAESRNEVDEVVAQGKEVQLLDSSNIYKNFYNKQIKNN